MVFTATLVIHHNFSLCWSLNTEGVVLSNCFIMGGNVEC